ncbi:MAG: flagellar hook protein FlgE [Candidatus Sericytochromatia bacterium]|nr:flagellar hook protein FlgE [Candidatus Sericytochromatia bacterium]
MIRSIFTGVSGMRNHQARMDVIGNNIANVNTSGFKYSRVAFADKVSQLISPSTAPGGSIDRGGVNLKQVGLGMSVATVDTVNTQGTIQTTGKVTDLALQGNGYFVMQDGPQRYYTRNGGFDFDRNGNLVAPGSGLKVMGYQSVERKDQAGEPYREIDQAAPIREVKVPSGSFIPPRKTTEVVFSGNLDQRITTTAPVNANDPPNYFETSTDVFDSLGTSHVVTFRFTHTAAGEWTWNVINNDPTYVDPASGNPRAPLMKPATAPNPSDNKLVFGANGLLVDRPPPSATPGIRYDAGSVEIGWKLPSGDIASTTIIPNFGSEGKPEGVTQFATASTAVSTDQNGFPRGDLTGITIDKSGLVSGVYSNGRQQLLAQMAIATFANPGGLQKEGDNIFIKSNNSGDAVVRPPGLGDAGTLISGALENSNVDLAEQFADMITTQRGFQASSRVITTSDEVLQELLNLKR